MPEVTWCKGLDLPIGLIPHFIVAAGVEKLQVYLPCFTSLWYKWEEGLGVNGLVGSPGNALKDHVFQESFYQISPGLKLCDIATWKLKAF